MTGPFEWLQPAPLQQSVQHDSGEWAARDRSARSSRRSAWCSRRQVDHFTPWVIADSILRERLRSLRISANVRIMYGWSVSVVFNERPVIGRDTLLCRSRRLGAATWTVSISTRDDWSSISRPAVSVCGVFLGTAITQLIPVLQVLAPSRSEFFIGGEPGERHRRRASRVDHLDDLLWAGLERCAGGHSSVRSGHHQASGGKSDSPELRWFFRRQAQPRKARSLQD